MRTPIATTLVALLLPLASPADAQTGRADRVIDGDTLVIQGETIRLWAIDAPEIDAICPGAERLDVGRYARSVLEWITEDKVISCWVPPDLQDEDVHQRQVRRCASIETGIDIAGLLVTYGAAAVCPQFATDFYDDNFDLGSQLTPHFGIYQPECGNLTLCDW